MEGFILNFPSAYAYVMPKSYFSGKPLEPVLTIAIRDILAVRSQLDDELVYDVTRTLIENRSQLIQMDDVYSMLETELNGKNFSFPLHQDAMNYLMRDKPSIWVRYSQKIWPFISIIAIIAGMFASIRNRLKRKQRDRIKGFYKDLLDIRKRTMGSDSNKEELIMK